MLHAGARDIDNGQEFLLKLSRACHQDKFQLTADGFAEHGSTKLKRLQWPGVLGGMPQKAAIHAITLRKNRWFLPSKVEKSVVDGEFLSLACA